MTADPFALDRFVQAQEPVIAQVRLELSAGVPNARSRAVNAPDRLPSPYTVRSSARAGEDASVAHAIQPAPITAALILIPPSLTHLIGMFRRTHRAVQSCRAGRGCGLWSRPAPSGLDGFRHQQHDSQRQQRRSAEEQKHRIPTEGIQQQPCHEWKQRTPGLPPVFTSDTASG